MINSIQIHRSNLMPFNAHPSMQLNVALKDKTNHTFLITKDESFAYQSKNVTVKELALVYLNR